MQEGTVPEGPLQVSEGGQKMCELFLCGLLQQGACFPVCAVVIRRLYFVLIFIVMILQ